MAFRKSSEVPRRKVGARPSRPRQRLTQQAGRGIHRGSVRRLGEARHGGHRGDNQEPAGAIPQGDCPCVAEDLNLHVNPYDNMTDEQLIARLRVLREQVSDLDTLPQRRISMAGPTKQ